MGSHEALLEIENEKPEDEETNKKKANDLDPLGNLGESPLIILGVRRRMSNINDVNLHLKIMGNLNRENREKEKFQKQLEIVRRNRLIKMHDKVLKLLGIAIRSAKYFGKNETSQSKIKI